MYMRDTFEDQCIGRHANGGKEEERRHVRERESQGGREEGREGG